MSIPKSNFFESLPIKYIRRILIHAQILRLPVYPIEAEIIPAPGIGKIILPITFVYRINGNGVNYDFGGSTPNIQLEWGATNFLDITNAYAPGVSALAGTDLILGSMKEASVGDLPSNLPIVIHDVTEGPVYTGGHVNDTLTVDVFYTILA